MLVDESLQGLVVQDAIGFLPTHDLSLERCERGARGLVQLLRGRASVVAEVGQSSLNTAGNRLCAIPMVDWIHLADRQLQTEPQLGDGELRGGCAGRDPRLNDAVGCYMALDRLDSSGPCSFTRTIRFGICTVMVWRLPVAKGLVIGSVSGMTS
jgi:hypothetical protein